MHSINRAIEYSTYSLSYELRGIIYFEQNKFSLAYKDFQKTVEITPKAINAWNYMGLINFFRGNYNEALAQYQKANELNPKNVGVLANMSLANWLKGSRTKAFEAMGTVLRGKPDSGIFYHYAYFHHLNGNQAFDFRVKFKVDIPGSADNKIATAFILKSFKTIRFFLHQNPIPSR